MKVKTENRMTGQRKFSLIKTDILPQTPTGFVTAWLLENSDGIAVCRNIKKLPTENEYTTTVNELFYVTTSL